MKDTREAVAAEVRAAAGRAGLKQSELARLASMKATSMNRKWNSETAFTVDELMRIADALGISPGTLIPKDSQGIAA